MKEIKLFDYQEDMKERIEKAFESHQSVMVQMPTGTGKTILLAEVVKSEKLKGKNPDGEKSEKLKGKNPCVWIVVHRRELVEQLQSNWILHFSLFTLHLTHWILHFSLFTLHLSKFSLYSGYRSIIMNWRRNLRSS